MRINPWIFRFLLVTCFTAGGGGQIGRATDRAGVAPEKGLLLDAVQSTEADLLKLPEQTLSPEQVTGLETAVKPGAPALRLASRSVVAGAGGHTATGRAFWSSQPVRKPAPPTVKKSSWARNPVDNFILKKLEEKQLSPARDASRQTLIRRVSFDLTGLPPTPEAIEEFLSNKSSNAYELVVDRLLASPQYGERWGRHWLDAAGYADSNGYFNADTDRPLAYKYRDYVVGSINADKPYDRFVQEQLAGDELCGYQPGGDITPEMEEALTATHFLRNAPDGTGESDGNPLELKVDRYSVLEGNVQILGSAFLGLTVQCARCHDHKFEPVKQAEYYQLQAILRPAFDPEHWLKPSERVLTVGTRAAREENKRQLEKYDREIKALKESLEGLTSPFRKLSLRENLEKISEPTRTALQQALDTKEKERTEEMRGLLKTNDAVVQIKDEDLTNRFPELAAGYGSLKEGLQKRETERPVPLPQLAGLTEPAAELPRHHLLVRGLYANEGIEVPPGVPAVFCEGQNSYQLVAHAGQKSSGHRLALARWLTSPENPVVARVLVNRIWQHHFGQGLVSTVDNLGVTGAKPSHPELLDYLAAAFVQSGWKLKSLQRLIVTSATYRQGGAFREATDAVDPENKLLWRFPLQRLDAESVRDAILFTCGELDLEVGGPCVPTKVNPDGQVVVDEANAGARRRSLYLQQRRTQPLTMLEVFDAAQMNPNCPRRNPSTVSLQSLALLNSDFIRSRSRAFAQRLEKECGDDNPRRLERAFLLALGRRPNPTEHAAAEEFLHSQMAPYASQPDKNERIWTDFCQMILVGNAFLYVE